jgi:hypothetical protein
LSHFAHKIQTKLSLIQSCFTLHYEKYSCMASLMWCLWKGLNKVQLLNHIVVFQSFNQHHADHRPLSNRRISLFIVPAKHLLRSVKVPSCLVFVNFSRQDPALSLQSPHTKKNWCPFLQVGSPSQSEIRIVPLIHNLLHHRLCKVVVIRLSLRLMKVESVRIICCSECQQWMFRNIRFFSKHGLAAEKFSRCCCWVIEEW